MSTAVPTGSASSRASALRNLSDDESGQVAIEFALVLPLILVFLFLIVDFGQIFNNLNDANNIAATGARFAAVDTKPTAGTLQSYLKAQGDTQKLRDTIGVCISFPTGASTVGNPVKVRVTSNFTFLPIIGDLVGNPTIPLHAEATMRLERPPSVYGAGC